MVPNYQDADTNGVPISLLSALTISPNASLLTRLVSKLNSIIHPTKPVELNTRPSAELLETRERLTEFLVESVTTISTLHPSLHEPLSKPNGGEEGEDEEESQLLLPPRDEVDQLLFLIPIAYLNRAITHAKLGYHDLSASDAYRAMLSVERFREWTEEIANEYEFLEESGKENGQFSGLGLAGVLHPALRWVTREEFGGNWATEAEKVVNELDKVSLWTIIHSLTDAGCLNAAQTYLRSAATRFSDDGDVALWEDLSQSIIQRLDPNFTSTAVGNSNTEFLFAKKNLPIRGLSRREVYPWNHYEPDRFAPSTLEKINTSIRKCCVSNVSGDPWCEVRCVELPRLHADGSVSTRTVKQLGVFTLRDIPASIPGVPDTEPAPHPYLVEPTTLIVHTTTGGPPGAAAAARCELCTKPVPEEHQGKFGCAKCEENDIWPSFCSKECKERAGELYHLAVCGVDWAWLHREAHMKLKGAKGEEWVFDDDAIYCLLVMRAWALALTTGVHPLELPEVWYLYGAGKRRKRYPFLDGTTSNQEGVCVEDEDDGEEEDDPMPFDFHQNVIVPHMILDAFQVEILPFPPQSHEDEADEEDKTDQTHPHQKLSRSPILSITHFDTATSTLPLLNKFKGVASLTHHLDKRMQPPIETAISAIHPLYSLVNHDCDPNVYWQVNERGEMCFRALDRKMKFWRDGKEWLEDGEWEGGLKRGMEIRDSYVDPGMEAGERRRKIWGVLGGACRCAKCEREEGQERGRGKVNVKVKNGGLSQFDLGLHPL